MSKLEKHLRIPADVFMRRHVEHNNFFIFSDHYYIAHVFTDNPLNDLPL